MDLDNNTNETEKKEHISDIFNDMFDQKEKKEKIKNPVKSEKKDTDKEENHHDENDHDEGSEKEETPNQKTKEKTSKKLSQEEELERANKRITESHKFVHATTRKLKNALKIAKELIDNGSLSEDEGSEIIKSLEAEDIEEEVSVAGLSEFDKILQVANKELENIKKYSDDDELGDKVKAFDYFLSTASKEEIEDTFDELGDLIGNPVALAKKILAIGKRHYDESYKEIKSAGGYKEYISLKNEEVKKLNKTIDKLNKRLAQLEDYDEPVSQRLREVSGGEDSDTSENIVDSIFRERDRKYRR